MTPVQMWAGWVATALVVCAWTYRELRVRRLQSTGDVVVSRVLDQLDEAMELAACLTRDHDAMRESVEREKKRGDDYFATIEGVVAERDARMKMYYAQVTEHGAAQAMLLRQIESLMKQYQRATNGKLPKLNPAVELVTKEFQANHVAPALAEAQETQDKSGMQGG